MAAYEDALTNCSTPAAPWHIIPANREWYRSMVVAELIEATFRDMDPQWPESEVDLSGVVIE